MLDYICLSNSIVCFVLGAFSLVVTLRAKIKDSMWELGVLRSIGCTNLQVTRVIIYEMIANTLSAMTLGYFSGVIVASITIAQYYTFAELPFKLELPYVMMFTIGVFALASLAFGTRIGTNILRNRSIATILQGD